MASLKYCLSSNSAPWYLIGCAAALPDFLRSCDSMIYNTWLFSFKFPFLIPLSLIAYGASLVCARKHQVAVRATFLGVMTGLGVQLFFKARPSYQGLGMYVIFLAWFHFSEYYFTETYNPKNAKLTSFMLNHSPAYIIALACSIIEFFIENWILPGMKQSPVLILLGFAFCVIGDIVRKRAMCVAGSNFNHIVQTDLSKQRHSLVTNDVYGFIQHPSYTGWFLFTIGTQVILCNPFCLVAFPCFMFRFFEDRVHNEEPALALKHGVKYRLYKENTPRFIPYLW